MKIVEKLGAFYIGKEYDLASGKLQDIPVIYDARDLTTHGVIVGMTGSGKTGLAIDILEEAALDKVPAIIIDPKGDMTNLMLTFPDLEPSDFLPWINEDDAERKGMTPEEYAKKTAEKWRNGLADWGEGPERIRALKASVDFNIYTPGSSAGIPVNVLQSLKAPDLSWDTDEEIIRERILGTVSAILGLLGIEADPVRSREHVLLSNIFEYYWRQGEDLDLPNLIMAIQKPPMERLGVFDVDTFFPEKDRFKLAMDMNSLLASPSFQSWLEGVPLDIGEFLHDESGKPRHSIFYIAHLNDQERMFFVTLLLEQVISWMRSQPGTTSLRALVYMDEVFGFFPPVAEPPSKRPMLTLLKQARAFGVGVLLATQNPVDLDYKGLTNAGTWFIGKLQTERDKSRLLDGLQNVAAGAGKVQDLEKSISTLAPRVFLLHNVHDPDSPHVFMTRWAMSYLRGPLTRAQIQKLMAEKKAGLAPAGEGSPTGRGGAVAKSSKEQEERIAGYQSVPPSIDPDVDQVFLPVRIDADEALEILKKELGYDVEPTVKSLVYRPMIYANAEAHFYSSRSGVDEDREYTLIAPPPEGRTKVDWDDAEESDLSPDDLLDSSEDDALFDDLPKGLESASTYKRIARSLKDYIYRTKRVKVFYNPVLKVYSRPGESERDFKIRCQDIAREKRDAEVDKLSEKFEKKRLKLENKLAREKQELEEDQERYEALKRETYLSAGESVLGFLLGRRSTRAVSSISRKHRIASQAKAQIEESEQMIQQIQEELKRLEQEVSEKAKEISDKWAEATENVVEQEVRAKKSDIDVPFVALAWAPFWMFVIESGKAKRRKFVKAY